MNIIILNDKKEYRVNVNTITNIIVINERKQYTVRLKD